MQSKTLKIVQAFMRAGRILSKIAFVVSIVGASLCLVCLISVAAGQGGILAKFGDTTIYGLDAIGSRYPIGAMYAGICTGLSFCLGEVAMAAIAKSYFKFELAQGTPFTLEGASKMHRLGAAIILINIGVLVLAQICYAIISMNFTGVNDMHAENYTHIGLGFTFILISLLCKLGAEQNVAA